MEYLVERLRDLFAMYGSCAFLHKTLIIALVAFTPFMAVGQALAADNRVSALSPMSAAANPSEAIVEVLSQDVQKMLGLRIATDATGNVRIIKVLKDSRAAEAGLHEGDTLKAASLIGGSVRVSIDSGNGQVKTFDLLYNSLQPELPKLAPVQSEAPIKPFTLSAEKLEMAGNAQNNSVPLRLERPQVDTTAPVMQLKADRFSLAAQQNAPLLANVTEAARAISRFDLELVIDRSGSMHRTDCPGGMARWAWCGTQANALGIALEPYIARGINVSLFAGDFVVFTNCRSDAIRDIFERQQLQKLTRLSQPLAYFLNTYLNGRTPGSKPLLIAVITDGAPFPVEEGPLAIQTIVDATRRMSNPREITIVIFQVGNDSAGSAFLMPLRDAVMKKGAAFDIVRCVPFQRLQQVGLAGALAEAIQNYEAQGR